MKFIEAITIYAIIASADIMGLILIDEDTKAGQILRTTGIILFSSAIGFIVSRGVISIICDLI